jgi:hypothetical protein
VEVLPLIIVNILQKMDPKTLMKDITTILENTLVMILTLLIRYWIRVVLS